MSHVEMESFFIEMQTLAINTVNVIAFDKKYDR